MNYQKLINFGIKRLRERLNLKQEELAEKIGVTPQGVSNIERNKYQPTADTINKICEVFNIHPVELLTEYPEDMDTQDTIKQINAIMLNMSKDELDKLLKVLTVLK